MNRLSPLSGLGSQQHAPLRSPGNVEGSILSTHEVPAGGVRHAIFAPMHYERNYAYPLIVWLHGPGLDERQLQRIMPLISMRNYVAVAPRAPWKEESSAGYCWSSDVSLTTAADIVFQCVERVREQYHVAGDRVFLAGHQSGGEMALRIALQHSGHFAGAITIGGPFPRAGCPLSQLQGARRLPMLIANSEQSEQYPLDQMCDDLRLFHAAGLWVTVRQYSCGEQIHPYMLRDMDRWLMEQVTGQEMHRDNFYTPGSQEAN